MSKDVQAFGIVPLVRRIALTLDADWQFAIKLSTDWPDNLTLSFEVGDLDPWEATIDGVWARFFVDKAVTNSVAQGTGWKFFARDDDGVEECWYMGTVVRYDEAA